MATKKNHASTQKFTEIIDFVDNIVILEGGSACQIIEITASNFALLSRKEQDTRIFSYASLLNSLSFPIQILIRNKRMDITNYLKDLEEIIKTTKNQQLVKYISYYKTFVHEMVTVNVVLNKAFYIAIPYSSLEGGLKGATQASPTTKTASKTEVFAITARKGLTVKTDSVLGQLQKFAVAAKILNREELIKLFYDIYNEGVKIEVEQIEPGIDASIITTEGDKV